MRISQGPRPRSNCAAARSSAHVWGAGCAPGLSPEVTTQPFQRRLPPTPAPLRRPAGAVLVPAPRAGGHPVLAPQGCL